MELVTIIVIIGIAVLALSIKHIIDTCKAQNSEYDTIVNNDAEIPPKYEEIDN